jgi:hypothetical protein
MAALFPDVPAKIKLPNSMLVEGVVKVGQNIHPYPGNRRAVKITRRRRLSLLRQMRGINESVKILFIIFADGYVHTADADLALAN